jgi:cell division septation protein DedD
MSYRPRFLATLVCLSFTFSIFAEEVAFINDDLGAGLNRASTEGKLIFVEFWATYCTPCKMMEEYTFTATSVIERLTDNYVPVKVNIQSFEGFDLKNQYKVTVLPTILILDSKGRQIARYEETMSPSKLNAILDKYNIPENRSRAMLASNTSTTAKNNRPATIHTNVAPQNTKANNNTSPYVASISNVVPRRTVPNTPNNNTTAIVRNTAVTSTNNTTNTTNTTRKPIATTATAAPSATKEVGLRREMPTNGFTIQVGAYGLASSAQMAIEGLKAKTNGQRQYIMQSKVAGKTTFRILIGSFSSRQEAEAYRKKIALEGYVRGFGEFAKK